MIPEYNKIDVLNDTKEVAQAKIDALKVSLSKGEITQEEYDTEKNRVEANVKLHKLGYAFTW
jgi:uncharacterized membrane protein